MKLIGGEREFKNETVFSYITDSGRSSLRLILHSSLKNKKFLIPDFLCKVILDVFDEFKATYSFYKVNEDLTINLRSIKSDKFDVLYLIDYFGQRHKIVDRFADDKLIIEDCTFLPVIEKPKNIKNWIGFNSFRKISYLADGSIMKSTLRLPGGLIEKKDADFSRLKYEAKRIKYEHLFKNKYSEEKYLDLFNKAEHLLDRQKNIYFISSNSLFNLFEFYKNLEQEYLIRRKNYEALDKYLKRIGIKLVTDYHSFYVLTVERRAELRRHLFSRRIFLPIHWPKINGIENCLYNKIISIPVDSRYNKKDMIRVAHLINSFYSKDLQNIL